MGKYKLDVSDRLSVMQLLPKESDFVTLGVIRKTVEIVSIKENEFKEFDIKQVGEGTQWNQKGAKKKSFEIGEVAENLIREKLEELNKEKKLEQRHYNLYESFVKANGD